MTARNLFSLLGFPLLRYLLLVTSLLCLVTPLDTARNASWVNITLQFTRALSDQRTEDTLKAEFRSHFRYRCWTSNVLLLHNSLDYLTITWWRQQNRGFFWDEPTRDRPINRDPRNGDRCLQLFLLHILPLCNVQCIATLEYLCFPNNAGLRFSFNCLK